MPVEIRELLIHTRIVTCSPRESAVLGTEQLAQLRKSIVQECLRALKDRTGKNRLGR